MKLPSDLLKISTEAQIVLRNLESKRRIDSVEQDDLFSEIKKTALLAALNHKNSVVVTSRFKGIDALKSLGFEVQSIKRDDSREEFLQKKLKGQQESVISKLAELTSLVPNLESIRFKDLGATDIFSLLVESANRGISVVDVNVLIERIVQKSWVQKNDLVSNQVLLSTALSETIRFTEVESNLAKVRKLNKSIAKNEANALTISWESALPIYSHAGVIDAQKLKWIVDVWPQWEAYFSQDIEEAASSGANFKEFIFFSAEYWGFANSFTVEVSPLPQDSVEPCTDRERESREYWAEISERRSSVKYNVEEKLLFNVEPLPVAELLLAYGFQVEILLDRSVIDEVDVEVESAVEKPSTSNEINLGNLDLDKRSLDQTFVLRVSWADCL